MVRSKALWTVAAIMFGVVTLAAAEDEESIQKDNDEGVQVGATADFFSKYVWRGQNIVDNWVFQPGANVSYQGLTGSIWSSLNMEEERVGGIPVGAGSLTETDLTLDYSHKVPGIDALGLSVGAIYYSYLNIHLHPTAEAYGGFNVNVPSAPSIRWYYDFDQANGSYVQFSVGHTIEKLKEWRDRCYCDLQMGASLGMGTTNYNSYYFGVDQTALNDLTLTVGLPITFGKLTIRPTLGYSTLISKPIRTGYAQSGGTRNDDFWGGVGLVYSF
jgi:hypothetical protein